MHPSSPKSSNRSESKPCFVPLITLNYIDPRSPSTIHYTLGVSFLRMALLGGCKGTPKGQPLFYEPHFILYSHLNHLFSPCLSFFKHTPTLGFQPFIDQGQLIRVGIQCDMLSWHPYLLRCPVDSKTGILSWFVDLKGGTLSQKTKEKRGGIHWARVYDIQASPPRISLAASQ